MMVQPGGNIEWWTFRSLALNENPLKTVETVIVWPLGRCSRLGAMLSVGQEHGRLKDNVSVGSIVGEGPSCKRASLSIERKL